MSAAPKMLSRRNREELATTIDSSLRLLDYSALAQVLCVSGPESARKLVESTPELLRLKRKIGRRARFLEADVRGYLEGLREKGERDAP